MSNFYNQSIPGAGTTGSAGGGGGFYNSSGYGQQYEQPQQQQQQQQSQQPQFLQPQQQQQGFSNVQQWQSSSSQQNSNYQQPQQQQSQQGGNAPNFWNPTTMAMAGLAAQAASGSMSTEAALSQVASFVPPAWKNNSMIPGFDAGMQMLRAYFAVDNRYVQRKMQKVLFPFTSRHWRRLQTEGPNMINYALPNSDENAPDLYLPLMSLITYCLLCALTYGTSGQFNAEVIVDVTTKCFVTQVLEVLLLRFGFYLMQAPVQILDLFSYTGYKYLGLTCNMCFGLLLGHLGYGMSGYYITLLWTASAASFFMLKTMANNIPTETAASGPKREVMVLAFAVSQAVTMWFVSQTQFL